MKKNILKNGSAGRNGMHTMAQKERETASRIESVVVNGNDLNIKELLTALTALKKGDFSVRLPLDWIGTAG
jgi:hypothetical protein